MTNKEYKALLARIEAENPGEPLLPLLRSGHSAVNEIYVKSATKRLPENADTPPIGEAPTYFHIEMSEILENVGNFDIHRNDEKWLELSAGIRRAYNTIRKTRNKFHSCPDDETRATVANEVAACWRTIQVAINRRQVYENTGEVTTPTDGADDLPDNPVELGKRLASIRVQITQTKNRIEDILASNETEKTKQERLQKAEASLQRLKNLRGIAEQRLKTLQAE